MTLPDLSNWDATKTALHQSLQALRSTRLLGVDPMPSDLHYGTLPTPSGATTGPLRFGGELRLDYVRAAAVYVRDGVEVFAVGLDGYNQTSFFDAVFAAFKAAGHNLQPNRDKVTETTAFDFDKGQASTYAALQWRMYSVLSRLKGRMYGPQTPIALWPHGFDLSTIWYADGMNERKDPHLNFGFSPGTPDVGQPYFYFYAWPVPDGLSERMPSIVTWNSNWSTPGGVIRYDQFAGADDPDGLVLDTLTQVYNTASAMVRANAAAD